MDGNTTKLSERKISPLLAKALPAVLNSNHASLTSQLLQFNYLSVFDIVRVGRMRFLRRHRRDFSGLAEVIFQNALSFATQLVHISREQGLRDADQLRLRQVAEGRPELPSYEELFPEPWDNFCRIGALEALNSPVAYLLELYQFARQLELDATEGAITLAQRRPDLAELQLDADNTNKEVPALTIVNEVLSHLAADYIDRTEDTGKPVNQVLGETYYPFTLPFSLPTMQVTLGLEEKKASLTKLIRTLSAVRPWFSSKMAANQQNSALLAATRLSRGQMMLLSDPSPFSMVSLTLPLLRRAYLSGSTTETLVDKDLSAHGYIVPLQEGGSGPTTLTYSTVLPAPDTYDLVKVNCTNQHNESVTVQLRGKAVLTYQRTKARLKPFDDAPPYSRQLELSWHDDDNPGIDLAKGPYFGKLIIQAEEWTQKTTFLSLTFDLVVSADGTNPAELLPESETFFMKNYGITLEQLERLPEILFFIGQTKETAEELERALSHGDFSPIVSPNVTFKNPIFTNGQSAASFPMPYQAGAVYLNSGHPDEMGINSTRPRSMTNTTGYRFDRLSRLLRLQRWTKLPHNELDLLLTSAMRAEGEHNLALDINFNTLRVLGLYRYLHVNYNLEAEAFAALVHSITPFGVSTSAALFDRVFNQPQLFDTPMRIDNSAFDYTARRGDDSRTVKQICAGLKITTATFLILAERVNSAFDLPENELVRSLEIVSALYRLVMISRLFKLTPEQGVMVVDILSSSGEFDSLLLAGAPNLSPLGEDENGESTTTSVDILDVILAVEDMANWLKQAKLTPEELSLIIQRQRLPIIATESSAAFFDSMLLSLNNSLLTENHFIAPDLPVLKVSAGMDGWMEKLSALVTEEGVIKPFPLRWDQDDEEYLNETITPIVEDLIPSPEDILSVVSALTQIIMQAKSSQEGLVSSSVTKEYGVSRDAVPLLLRWVGYSVTELLQMLLAQAAQHYGRIRNATQVNEELLLLAYNLAMSGSLLKQLRLTPRLLFMRLANPSWLNLLPPTRTAPLSLEEVYLLSRYRSWVIASRHSEEELIEYIAYANNPPGKRRQNEIDRDCAELLADILDWDPDEIEVACFDFTPARACSIEQIDWLRRAMALSQQTGLSVTSLLDAAKLPPLPSFAQIKIVGDAVIAATQTQLTE